MLFLQSPFRVRLANTSKVLLKLRKHEGCISSQYAQQQQSSAVKVRATLIKNAIASMGGFHGKVALHEVELPWEETGWLHALANPAKSQKCEDIYLAFAALLRLESFCIQFYSSSSQAQEGKEVALKELKQDCNARAGELVTAAMKLDEQSQNPKTSKILVKYLDLNCI